MSSEFLRALLFTIVLAFFVAKLEINIEGKHGWAENLPTWRKKSKILSAIWGKSPLTGYHAWLFSTIFVFLHLPFFVVGGWSLQWEFRIISLYFFFWIIEDFLWFVLNPYFGIGKFNKENIPWHPYWFGPFPLSYYRFLFGALLLLTLSYFA